MKIEIRDETRPCEVCGAGAAIFTPSANQHLEREFDAYLDGLFADLPWFRFGKKRLVKKLKVLKDTVAAELRQATVSV